MIAVSVTATDNPAVSEAAKDSEMPRYVSHFATCQQANAHERSRADGLQRQLSASHTPGPWHVDEESGPDRDCHRCASEFGGPCRDHGYRLHRKTGGKYSCETFDVCLVFRDRKNALLAAAAPEMHDLLDEFLGADTVFDSADFIGRVSAVLRKARGDS
jgi:hypothetical protein